MSEFEIILNRIITPINPSFVIIVGDFNAKLSIWKKDDPDTREGVEIGALTSSFGLTQMISEATHILPNSSTCIDLLFTNQPNLIIEAGVYPSLHPNCHHQIIFAKINFEIFFPPIYDRQIWHYNNADVNGIRESINNVNWDRVFLGINVNKQVEVFNNYIMNIFHNYIPNETISINDNDPPWITKIIKMKISNKDDLYKNYIRNGRTALDFQKVQEACNLVNNLILKSKDKYYNRMSLKLKDPNTSPKAYWSILKSFFSDKKIPVIPPVFVNNEYITDFKTKADQFNIFFSNQCTLVDNSSTLPNHNILPLNSLTTCHINADNVLELIRSLDANKSHGFDQISARMLKIGDKSIVKPLLLIFENALNEGTFPLLWKKANVTPIHKKGDKSNIKNYRPISVLPLCGKLFERIIFNSLYSYFNNNNILNVNQSGFRSGDSCINQLLDITHMIFKSFDANPSLEIRGVFLDISKAFDKVWHNGVLFKLRSNGVEGKLLDLIESFLCERYQRVVLNGQSSCWLKIKAGVPQGSILGPLLFLIYINDISNNLESNVKLFADDTSLFSIVFDKNLSSQTLNNDLIKIQQWAYQWKMNFNPDASKQAQEVIFSRKTNKPQHPDLLFNQSQVQRSDAQKHLGVILDNKLNFNQHVKCAMDKANKGINVLRKLRYYVPRDSLIRIYKTFIRSQLDYADIIYDQPSNMSFCDKLESIQYNSALAITGAIRGTSKDKLYKELGLESLSSRRWFKRLCQFYKIIHGKTPEYLYSIISKSNHSYNTRHQYRIPQYFCRTNYFQNSFFPYTISEWNKLDPAIVLTDSINIFKKSLLKTVRPIPNSLFDACDPLGIQLLTRLRVGLSHLRDHKFKHGFQDTINPLCPCNMETESVSHFFLRCLFYTNERLSLIDELLLIVPSILVLNENHLIELLLYGKKDYSNEINTQIINLSIKYIIETKRFDIPLL